MTKRWIQKTMMKKGALRRQLEVPAGKTIGKGKLNEIRRTPVGKRVSTYGGHRIAVTQKLKRRAGLAERLMNIKRK